MIGPILVTLLVAAIVGSYMTIVNRMLRSDEHWSESNAAKPALKREMPMAYGLTAPLAHT